MLSSICFGRGALTRTLLRSSVRAAPLSSTFRPLMNASSFSTLRSPKDVGSDEVIAREGNILPIMDLCKQAGLPADQFEPYGKYKAKVPLECLDNLGTSDGKLILVTALTPTKLGEGKTCTSVGLADGLCHIGKNAMVALREPSLGPVFGVKGGAAGGGYAQLIPMTDINLHFTGDMHAIGAAHNLLSAMVDNHLYWRSDPPLDSRRVQWRRVVDMNDRALRSCTVGMGGILNGYPRQDGYDITVASEVMAIFCLATGIEDLQRRLGNIIIGYNNDFQPVTCRELKADGAMAALLKDAIAPNLVQTLENNLGFVHGGPFANIAHGCSTVLATKAALKMSDYVVTEGGFGADLGAEKFFNIKCRKAGISPAAAVCVATVRALKMHGGADAKTLTSVENVEAVTRGMPNLERHVSNIRKFGVPVVVAINKFPTDTDAEVKAVHEACEKMGVQAVMSDHWANGGVGGADLAAEVVNTIENGPKADFKLLYPDEMPLDEKIRTIATEIYGADGITIDTKAATQLKKFAKMGFGHLPVCMAKTQYSFSSDPKALGAPSGFEIPVREVRLSAGAEFVVALTGDVMTMPGLGRVPSAQKVHISKDDGYIHGLF